MRVNSTEYTVSVTLSERNVRELYAQLERLEDGDPREVGLYHAGYDPDSAPLRITIETDEDHYGERLPSVVAYNYGRWRKT